MFANMSIFDEFYFTFFQHFKPNLKSRANTVALIYISVLQSSILLLLGVFFAAFFSQMHLDTMDSDKAWTLFVLVSVLIYLKNWLQFSGRKRTVIKAKLIKRKTKGYNIWLLFLLPICCVALSLILLQVL